jgi:hypothetical protein
LPRRRLMNTRTIVSKVAGVTYPEPTTGEDRQRIIALLTGDEPCRLVPEPTNAYDPNAIAVHVATSTGVRHVGFVPRDLAKQIAPHLEGEAVMSRILEVTGGFTTDDGDTAAYGLRIVIEIPDDKPTAADGA